LHGFSVGTPTGMNMIAAYRVKDSHVLVSGVKIEVDLIVLDMYVYDIILGMDWLAKNHASIDCHKKEVVFTPPSKTRFKFKGTSLGTVLEVISMMKGISNDPDPPLADIVLFGLSLSSFPSRL